MVRNAMDKLRRKNRQLYVLADHLKTLDGRTCSKQEVLRLIN